MVGVAYQAEPTAAATGTATTAPRRSAVGDSRTACGAVCGSAGVAGGRPSADRRDPDGGVMRVHVFYPGPHTTWDDRRVCEECGEVESSKVHEVPVQPDEARLIDARRIGETP
jgi:hypothetical protein